MTERRIGDPRIISEVKQALSRATFPYGPTGYTGREREVHTSLRSPLTGSVAQIIYRALRDPSTRTDAELVLDRYEASHVGVTLTEWALLQEARAFPARERSARGSVTLGISLPYEQVEWLRSLGPSMSANVRTVVDAAMQAAQSDGC